MKIDLIKRILEVFPGSEVIVETPDRENTPLIIDELKAAGISGTWRKTSPVRHNVIDGRGRFKKGM